MKREDLKALGLNDEQIDKIMAQNGADIENAKQGGAADRQRADDLQAQLDRLTTDLAAAQKSAGDAAALKDQLAKANGALDAMRKANAIRDALAEYKPKDARVLARLLDDDKISYKDNTLDGLKEQVEALRTSSGYLFADTPDDKGGSPDAGHGGGEFDMNSFLRGK